MAMPYAAWLLPADPSAVISADSLGQRPSCSVVPHSTAWVALHQLQVSKAPSHQIAYTAAIMDR